MEKERENRQKSHFFIQMEGEMDTSSNKPLAATLMQEFQNLKDKLKNEDDSGFDRG